MVKNDDFLLTNDDFLLKNDDFYMQTGVELVEFAIEMQHLGCVIDLGAGAVRYTENNGFHTKTWWISY